MNFWDLDVGEIIYMNVGLEKEKENFHNSSLHNSKKYSRSGTILSLNNRACVKSSGFFKKTKINQGELRVQFTNDEIQIFTEKDWENQLITYEPLFEINDFEIKQDVIQEQTSIEQTTHTMCEQCPYMQYYQQQQQLAEQNQEFENNFTETQYIEEEYTQPQYVETPNIETQYVIKQNFEF